MTTETKFIKAHGDYTDTNAQQKQTTLFIPISKVLLFRKGLGNQYEVVFDNKFISEMKEQRIEKVFATVEQSFLDELL
jgi:hypothetical protein